VHCDDSPPHGGRRHSYREDRCHTVRATRIKACIKNGGRLEFVQQLASIGSPRTAMLYDRSSDEISLDEVEKIAI
jgi:integrase/recombinase XerD